MKPPWVWRALVAWLTPPASRDALVDDLDEAFAHRVDTEGLAAATRWYRRQVLTGLGALARWRADERAAGASRTSRRGGMPILERSTSTRQDVRYALRALRRSPGFTTVALLSLALGLGANIAIFSVIHAVLLKPLPYPDPARLRLVTPPGVAGDVTLPEFEYWRDQATSFSSVAAAAGRSHQVMVTIDHVPMPFESIAVSDGYFRTLGVRLAAGEEFRRADTRANATTDVVITDRLWRRAFDGDPSAIGRAVTIDSQPTVVRGVLPPSFWSPHTADVYWPLQPTGSASDNGTNFEMIARLAPSITAGAANGEMASLSARFPRVTPAARDNWYGGLTSMDYQASIAGDVSTNLWLVFGATALLLVIACANLGGLLVARLAARRKERAMRFALGASRFRLWRQVAVENMIICLAGGVLGVFGASVTLKATLASVPVDLIAAGPIGLDLTVLSAALAAVIVTGLVLSLVAVGARDLSVHETLKSLARAQGSRASHRTRRILVVSEVALSVALLVGAALLTRSLLRLSNEPLGFSPDGVLTFWTPLPDASATDRSARSRFELALTDRLKAIPGITDVGAVNVLPLTGQSNYPTERVGHPESGIGGMEIRAVTPGYFNALHLKITAGRALTAADTAAGDPVMLVNETVARRWWPSGSPLGDRVAIGRLHGAPFGDNHDPMRTVVGVVADAKSVTLAARPRPTVYFPSSQAPWINSGTAWAVRGPGVAALADTVRRTVADFDPHQRVDGIRAMTDIISGTTAAPRFSAWLSGAFAIVALTLTTIGVYGLLAFSVARRTSEIGLRMALGAPPSRILRAVVGEGLSLILIGLAIGLAGAVAITRTLTSLLFGITATDGASFATVAVLLLVVGLGASAIPASRASRIDPLEALRVD